MSDTLNIKSMAQLKAEGKTPDILFWVGCAGTFDARAIKISKAFSSILDHAGISYGVLGEEEQCCGDPARRAGNEFVFTMLALQNVETIKAYNIKKIVTTCPHGFHTLKNEYPSFGGEFEVLHHTQYILELIKAGKLKIENSKEQDLLSYHDSCYLGRINGETKAPREIMKSLKAQVKEVGRSGNDGFCCGAGGAQMFKEEEKGEERVNTNRAKEFIDNGCNTITANCPFCVTMLEDGLKDYNKEDEIKVLDIAEYLSGQLKD